MNKHYFGAIATLMGTIIGAGVLGIPYAIAKAGFLTGVVNMVVVGLIILGINLFLGEVVLRTKGVHQLTGYAEKYLGKLGKKLITITMAIGIYGAMIAYLIGEGEALAAIFGGSPMAFILLFFALTSLLVYFGIRTVEDSEIFFVGFKLLLFIAIFFIIIFSGKFAMPNIFEFNLSRIFLPYGVILFAYIGAVAIPEMRVELEKNLKQLKSAIIIGSIIPLVMYLLFALVVIGVTGLKTTEVATVGIGNLMGTGVAVLVNLFGIIAMFTSYIALALALVWMYKYDYKINRDISFLLTILPPILFVLLGVKSFINVVGFTGAIAGGFEGVLIIMMYYVAKKKGQRKPEFIINIPKPVGYLMMGLFVLAAIWTVAGIF